MSADALIRKRFAAIGDSPAFQLDIHLRVPAGITVLFGPSGSGKTLTLNCLAGFARPDEGRILIEDRLVFDDDAKVCVPARDRRCGYLFQDHALFPHMSVRDNLRFAAAVSRDKQRELARRRRVNELLEIFELTELARRKPAQLSGGQRQRAALARMLLSEPALVLLDEPARGLDLRLKMSFHAALQAVRQRLNVPMLLVTHDPEECFELANHLCLLQQGHIVQMGPAPQVLSKPASADAARLLGLYALLPAEIRALDPGRGVSRAIWEGREIEGPYFPGHLLGDRGLLCIRQSELKAAPPETRRGTNMLLLDVENAAASAGGVRLRLAGGLSATVSEADYDAGLRGQTRVQVFIPPGAVSFVAGP